MAVAAPAFQFYVKEWRSSRPVQLMTFAVRGMYLEMLLEQWEKLTLPDSAAACAHLLGGTLEEWDLAWAQLRQNFVARGHGRIVNRRLERVRTEARAYREHMARNSKQGGINRAASASRGTNGTYLPGPSSRGPAGAPAGNQPPPASASATATATDLRSASATGALVPTARSARPIYTSDRFAVFEWQLDELSKVLGSHFADFDLHAFFDDLTQQSRASGLVIPTREVWPWLQAEVLKEAAIRGFTMASHDTGPPTNKRIAGLVTGGQAFLNRRQP